MGISRSRRLINQLWLPTLVLIVVVVAGFTIDAARGIFGSQGVTPPGKAAFSAAPLPAASSSGATPFARHMDVLRDPFVVIRVRSRTRPG
jgi:Mycobacterium membrane protein